MEPVFIIKFHYLIAYNTRFGFFEVRSSAKTHNVGYFLFQLMMVSAIHTTKKMMNSTQNTIPVIQAENHLSGTVSIMFISLYWMMIQIISRLTFVIRFIHLSLLVTLIYHVFFKTVHVFKDLIHIKRQVKLV